MENIIEIKNVSFKYSSEEETENYVLNDLSLNIEKYTTLIYKFVLFPLHYSHIY